MSAQQYVAAGLAGMIGLGLETASAVAAGQVINSTWTGAGDGMSWTDEDNWSNSPNQGSFPNNGDGFVYLATIEGDTVSLDQMITVEALTLSGAFVEGGNLLNVTENFLSDSTSGCAGLGGSLVAEGNGVAVLGQWRLENWQVDATAKSVLLGNANANGSITLQGGARLRLHTGLEFQRDGGLQSLSDELPLVELLAGGIAKTGAGGPSTISEIKARLTSMGTAGLSSTNGVLEFSPGFTATMPGATITVSNLGTVRFKGTTSFLGNLSVSCSDDRIVDFFGGQTSLTGTMTSSGAGRVTLGGGAAVFEGGTLACSSSAPLSLEGGRLKDTLITGAFRWQDGTLSGTVTNQGADAEMSPGIGSRAIEGTFVNEGTFKQNEILTLTNASAKVQNLAGGQWTMRRNVISAVGPEAEFFNAGTVTKTSPFTAVVQAKFVMSGGTVICEEGLLDIGTLENGGAIDGTWSARGSGMIRTNPPPQSVVESGQVEVDGQQASFDGLEDIGTNAGNVTIAGGATQTFTRSVSNQGWFTAADPGTTVDALGLWQESGVLDVTGGASMEVDGFDGQPSAAVAIADTGLLTVDGTMSQVDGALAVTGGGQLNCLGDWTITGTRITAQAGDINADGTIDATDVDLVLESANVAVGGDLHFDGGGIVSMLGDVDVNGMLTMADFNMQFEGGSLTSSDAMLDGVSGSWAEGDWNTAGSFTAEDLALAFEGGAWGVNGGAGPGLDTAVITTSQLDFSGGAAWRVNVPLTSTGTVVNATGAGTSVLLSAPATIDGAAWTVGGGAGLVATAPLSLGPGAVLTGDGTHQTASLVNDAGTIAPGPGTQTLVVDGDYTQGPLGTIAIELGGRPAGGDNDRVDVSGAAQLDGTLTIALVGGFTPSTGDAFMVLSAAGGASGTFHTFVAPPGFAFAVKTTGVLVSFDRPPCPADIDGSGAVDFGDLVALLSVWGPCPGCPQDLDGDDVVAFPDLLVVLGSWGACP